MKFIYSLLIAALIALLALVPVQAREPKSAGADVALADLPKEARDTLAKIRAGGPFPHPAKDGSVFGNREKRLPPKERGYYREYTVPTPGARDRGARRIIAGGEVKPSEVKTAGDYWYTDDHYNSLRRIRE